MEEFGAWLEQAPTIPEAAFDAHFRLTAIHPFSDGNGRTTHLLMNLLLIRGPLVVETHIGTTYPVSADTIVHNPRDLPRYADGVAGEIRVAL
jgi:Fic family protein